MGIPHYFQVIADKYPLIITNIPPKNIEYLFIDFNGCIHPCAHNVIANKDLHNDIEKNIINECWNYTQKIISIAKGATPSIQTYICTDGVAPFAKLNQQRKRRYLSVFRKKMEGTEQIWDTNAISPGTEFMKKLGTYFNNLANDKNNKIIYNSADEFGEGEHKIFNIIKNTIGNTSGNTRKNNIVIHGLDADMIMLSLISHHSNIYLMRDNNKEIAYLNIDELRKGILSELESLIGYDVGSNDIFSKTACETIESYIVVCFILGNDFIPHATTLTLKNNGYDKLIINTCNIWKTSGKGVVTDNKISIDFIHKLIGELSKDEDIVIKQTNDEYMKKSLYKSSTGGAINIDLYPLQHKQKDNFGNYLINNPLSNKWRLYYYKFLFNTNLHDTETILNACNNYIKGILWTYNYYKQLPIDYKWFYPYGYAPSLLDIYNYLHTYDESYWETTVNKWNESTPMKSSIIQLLSILPIDSYSLLPEKYHKLFFEPKYGCADLYPSKYNIQIYSKKYLWECYPQLPSLDIKRIQKIVNNIS